MTVMKEAAKDRKEERCAAFIFCLASKEVITETPLVRGSSPSVVGHISEASTAKKSASKSICAGDRDQ